MFTITALINKEERRRLREELNIADYEGVMPMVPRHILQELLDSVRENYK